MSRHNTSNQQLKTAAERPQTWTEEKTEKMLDMMMMRRTDN